jgi:hypothetical protein
METFHICLRDLSGKNGPVRMLVDVERTERRVDWDPITHKPIVATYELSDEYETEAFLEFVEKARMLLPLQENNVDVYIGWWVTQGTFVIPQEFFALIAETGWKVTFDLND